MNEPKFEIVKYEIHGTILVSVHGSHADALMEFHRTMVIAGTTKGFRVREHACENWDRRQCRRYCDENVFADHAPRSLFSRLFRRAPKA